MVGELGFVAHDVITYNRMNLDFAQETTASFDHAEEEHGNGNANGRVDAIFDAGKDRDQDSGEKDDDFQRGNPPELVDGVWGSDEVADSVDNHGGKGRVRDIKEDGRQSVDGQENHDGGKQASQGSPNAGFGFDRSAGERPSGGIGAEERTKQIGHADGYHFLGRINGVVVDAAERLRNGNMFDQ